MKVKDFSPENRPRERLQQLGPSSLSTAELLALILKSGTQKENILDLCHKLLGKYGLAGLSKLTLPELEQEHGIGTAKASQVIAVFELHRRSSMLKSERLPITTAKDVAQLYLPKLSALDKEHFIALYLDTKNNIICDQTISIGTLNASLVHPREVFHGAIKHLAHALIVIHNHPSGDPAPSEEDLQITKQLQKTGQVMGIPLLDHIILGKETWWSWREKTS